MIVVLLAGGLGNQMFQYALARNLAQRNGGEIAVDLSYLNYHAGQLRTGITSRKFDLDIFAEAFKVVTASQLIRQGIFISHSNSFFSRLVGRLNRGLNRQLIVERKQQYRSVFPTSSNLYIAGYWQSYKYFEQIGPTLGESFRVKRCLLLDETCRYVREIRKQPSVCLHIRRTDFLKSGTHRVLPLDYYKQALEILLSNQIDTRIFVFSDDIEWCQRNLETPYQMTFLPEEISGPKASNHFYLMTQCQDFVIANSTFSWWTAWLGDHPSKRVVAPKQWFEKGVVVDYERHLLPPSWIRL